MAKSAVMKAEAAAHLRVAGGRQGRGDHKGGYGAHGFAHATPNDAESLNKG